MSTTEAPPHPFFALFGDDPLGAARAIAELGPVSEVRLGPMRAAVISDPAVAHALFTGHRADLHALVSFVEPRLHGLYGNGLLGASGDEWKLLRKIVTPEFSRSRLEASRAVVVRRAEQMTGEWRDRAKNGVVELDFDLELGTLARDALLEITFGHRPTEPERTFYEALVAYNEKAGLAQRAEDPSQAMVGFQEPLEELRRLLDAATAATPDDEGLVARLGRARDDTGAGLSPAQVRDTLFSVLLAGILDVQSCFGFLGQLLGVHRSWQAIVRGELEVALAEGLRPGLDELPCLRASIQEALRLFPTSLLLSGWAQRAIEVPGLTLAPRDLAFVVLPALFRSPGAWPFAEAFVPQRFLRPGLDLKKVGFNPFGIGMRTCVGAGLAMMEIQAAFALVLRDWQLEALAPGVALGVRAGQLVAREPVRIRATLGSDRVPVATYR